MIKYTPLTKSTIQATIRLYSPEIGGGQLGALFFGKACIYTVMTETLQAVREHLDESERFIGTEERWYDDGDKSFVVVLLHPEGDMEWYA